MLIPGSKLKEYRKQRRVSAGEFAKWLGYSSPSSVTFIEKKDLTPLEFAAFAVEVERVVLKIKEDQQCVADMFLMATREEE